VGWSERGLPRIGYALLNGPEHIHTDISIGELFPRLDLGPGEIACVEIVEMENGYFIGFVDEESEDE